MVEVFKTDVKCPFLAQQIIADILALFVDVEVSFDLEDRDCILRLSTEQFFLAIASSVYEIVESNGGNAQLLIDEIDEQTIFNFSSAATDRMSINALMRMF